MNNDFTYENFKRWCFELEERIKTEPRLIEPTIMVHPKELQRIKKELADLGVTSR